MSTTPKFSDVMAAWDWREIEGCPGRYVLLQEPPPDLARIVGEDCTFTTHKPAAVRDTVLVTALDGGGMISYLRDDGGVRHTLNTEAGFDRKLRQLGLRRAPDDYL